MVNITCFQAERVDNTNLTNNLLCSFSEDPSKTVRNAMHMSVHTDSLSILPCDAHHLFSEKIAVKKLKFKFQLWII